MNAGSDLMLRVNLAAGAGARAGSRMLIGRYAEVADGGDARVYYVDGFRVVIGQAFSSCECPANRERCPHVNRVLEHRAAPAAGAPA